MPSPINRVVLLGLIVALLAGCGFSLRGAGGGGLALQTLALDADRSDGMVRELRQRLQSLGVETRAEPGNDGHYTLTLRNEQRGARRTTLNSGTRGAQYDLSLAVDATLSLGGRVIAGPRSLAVQRQHDEDLSNLTSAGSERELLYEAMERELADQIVQQLRTVPPANGNPAP